MTVAAPPLDAPPLRARDLVLQRGGRRVVDGVSLCLQAGQLVALAGPNGAGKSSLLALLAGLQRADAGSVELDGRPLARWPLASRARRLAWLSQQAEVAGELPVHQLVMLGRLPHIGLLGEPSAADHAAVQAALHETDCSALVQRRVSALSGGERQRVLLARALAVQASLLLLDEPTAHLDAPHQSRLMRSLRARTAAGHTVLAVLHDLNLALAADRLLVLAAGRLLADGSPDDAGVRQALVQVFDDALQIVPAPAAAQPGCRWMALPRL